MPFLRKPDLAPVKGIDLSIPSTYLGPGFHFPQNLQFERGEMRKRAGKSAFGGQTTGAKKVLHLGSQEVSTGVFRLFRMTKTNIEKYNTLTGAWDNVTGADLTGAESDFFADCVVTESDLYLFTNRGVDAIRKYDGSGNTANLGGSPPKCRAMAYVTPYVLIGNVTDGGNAFPTKVQWCDTGLPEVWSGGNSGSQLLSDEPSHIRSIKKLRDYAMVYKSGSVYRGRKVSTASIFDFSLISTGKGIYAPRAIADDGENHYYMGAFDFHRNNGLRVEDIGKPVREYIFNRLNRSASEACHAIHMEQYKEVWFFITVADNSYATEVWKYNYEMDFWYFDTCANLITANVFKSIVDVTWEDLVGTWEEQTIIWDEEQGASQAPITVFGHDTGHTSFLDKSLVNDFGLAVDARLETKDYTGLEHKGIEYDTRWLQFDAWAKGSALKLYYSIDYGSTWVYVGENALTGVVEKSIFYFDVIAKHIRFRLVQDELSKDVGVRSFTPYFLDAGEVR